jgi:putative tryptophan/tyrosine transport system substrate-binding protein
MTKGRLARLTDVLRVVGWNAAQGVTLLAARLHWSAPSRVATGQTRVPFAAVQGPDLLYSICDPWRWGKPMKRREFITLLGGAAAWPFDARAQQPAMPVVGVLSASGQKRVASQVSGFLKGLNELGFTEGRKVAVEIRATDAYDHLPGLAAELVGHRVALICAAGAANSAQAAKAATTTIPIVFVNGSDPIMSGLVTSMNHPGGNVTGIALLAGQLAAKRLELLGELVPQASRIGLFVNPTNARHKIDEREIQAAARNKGYHIVVLPAANPADLDIAFTTAAHERAGACLVTGDAFFVGHYSELAALAARYQIPTSYPSREAIEVGGLMSYGDDRQDSYRQAGIYAGRILQGAKPADLPVLQPTKFELVINSKTAKTLGLIIPDKLLALADEVIE